MELQPGIIADRTALWFPDHSILCFADLHLGYEEELAKKGVHMPLNEFTYQQRLFDKLMHKYRPKTVVLNGDVKHSFGYISDMEWRHSKQLLEMLTALSDVIIIKGNHDIALQIIATKHKLQVKSHHKAGDILFLHGDALPTEEMLENTKTIVIGHEHPAIGLTNGIRTELYKCFLTLPWKKRTLIVQPSTFSLTQGTDVLSKQLMSPFLESLAKAEVFVVGEDQVLAFGKLSRI
jgi:uncharacterized protein